jgi:hypothetical protein
MNKAVTNIVFTKNRPLQLEAYLRSMYQHFPAELMQTYVIYKKSDDGEFANEYQAVFSNFKDLQVVDEKDFNSDLMGVINEVQTKYILFGIDDVVFFDSVDFGLIDKIFDQAGDDIFGFTLRFGEEIRLNGKDNIIDEQVGTSTVYKFDWTQGKTSHTRYPFELCCTFYRTDLVKRIFRGTMSQSKTAQKLFAPNSLLVKALPFNLRRSLLKHFGFFFSPNTLESWPCRWSQQNSDSLPRFTYFQKLCCSAVQVNIVNTSTANAADGTEEHTVEALNEKFKQGYRMDTDYVAKNPPSELACGRKFFRLKKI